MVQQHDPLRVEQAGVHEQDDALPAGHEDGVLVEGFMSLGQGAGAQQREVHKLARMARMIP